MLPKDFRQRWTQLRDAIAAGRADDMRRLWDDIGEQLQGLASGGDANVEANHFSARIATGETVTPNMTVCVIDGVAYAADGDNAARQASGVAVRGSGRAGEILWTPGDEFVLVRCKRSTAITGYGALYQSVDAGVLTNDPEESGLAYVQKVGQFVRWENPKDGSTPDLAWVWLDVCGESGSGDIEFPVTSVNGQTGDVDLWMGDIYDYDDSNLGDGMFIRYKDDIGPGGAGGYEPWPITGTGGILGDYTGPAAESGVVTGMLVHVDAVGEVWKADATSWIRFATHWARSGTGVEGSNVICTAVPSEYSVFCDNEDPFQYSNILYLSEVNAGYATPKPPAMDGSGYLRQIVGTMASLRDGVTGKCDAVIGIEGPVLG